MPSIIKIKNIFSMRFSTSILFSIFCINVYAQHNQGKIVYEVTFDNTFFSQSKKELEKNKLKQMRMNLLNKNKKLASEISTDAIISQFPKVQTEYLFFKKDTIVYWDAPVISSNRGDGTYDTLNGIQLKENNHTKALVLMNVLNKKEVHILNNKRHLQPIKIRYKSEKKEILGFKCKKAILFYEDKKNNRKWEDVIFYAKDIPNPYFLIENLKGCPLQIIYSGGVIKTAKEISFESVPTEKFEIPKDYNVIIRD